jgi:DNA-binding LytR/AlgR family response regulator
MNIALCEDNPLQSKLIVEGIMAWAGKSQPQQQSDLLDNSKPAVLRPLPKIHEYSDANSFFFNQETDGPYDLLLLDIDLSGNELEAKSESGSTFAGAQTGANSAILSNNEDGLKIAARVREHDKNAVIVFITSNTWQVFRGYKVQAYDFLVKPLQQRDLERVLDYANSRTQGLASQTFLLNTGSGSKRVLLSDIYYFEAQRQYVKMHWLSGEDVFRGQISEIATELSSQEFIAPHRSFLVNLALVRSINNSTITMSDGRIIPISRNKQKETRKAWLDYFSGSASAQSAATKSAATKSAAAAPTRSPTHSAASATKSAASAQSQATQSQATQSQATQAATAKNTPRQKV